MGDRRGTSLAWTCAAQILNSAIEVNGMTASVPCRSRNRIEFNAAQWTCPRVRTPPSCRAASQSFVCASVQSGFQQRKGEAEIVNSNQEKGTTIN